MEIKDIDKFELNLRNRLTPVMPKVPPVTIRFISVDGKDNFYLVVIFIEHDYYAPYIHLENEKNYKIYKRDGNQKRVVGYTELKSMFVQSRVLEDEILRFREKRIAYYKDKGIGERFLLLHVIPESFLDEKQPLFVIEKRHNINLGVIFAGSQIDSFSLPGVDGLRYTSASGDAEAILYNNGIAEFLLPLTIYVASMREGFYFCNEDIWEYVERISQGYQRTMTDIFGGQRYFGCISIIGCKDVISEGNGVGRQPEIICQPVCFMDMTDTDAFYSDLKRLQIEYLLSLGIRHNDMIMSLINEIREGSISVKNEV